MYIGFIRRQSPPKVQSAARRIHRVAPFCIALSLAVVLSSCVFSVPGSSISPLELKEDQYFAQGTRIQADAATCPTSACKDAELTAAVHVYEKVLQLDSLNKFAYYNIGVIYLTSGQYSAASMALQKALLIDQNYFPVLYNLAYIQALRHATGTAMSLYKQATTAPNATNMERAKAYFNLGDLCDIAGRRVQGDAAFTEAVTLDPALLHVIPSTFVPPSLR